MREDEKHIGFPKGYNGGIQKGNREIARRNRIRRSQLGRVKHKDDHRTVTGRDIERELCS